MPKAYIERRKAYIEHSARNVSRLDLSIYRHRTATIRYILRDAKFDMCAVKRRTRYGFAENNAAQQFLTPSGVYRMPKAYIERRKAYIEHSARNVSRLDLSIYRHRTATIRYILRDAKFDMCAVKRRTRYGFAENKCNER